MAIFQTKKLPFLSDSIDLLQQMKGQRIAGLVRLLSSNPAESLGGFHKVREDQVFAWGHGPVFLTVESGLCIGFSDQDIDRSVVAWKEVVPLTLEVASEKCNYYQGGPFISCKDKIFSENYWSNLVGCRIERLAILKVENGPDPREYRNERGLLIATDDGKEWLISTSLSESGPGGFLLMPRDDISEEYTNRHTLIDI